MLTDGFQAFIEEQTKRDEFSGSVLVTKDSKSIFEFTYKPRVTRGTIGRRRRRPRRRRSRCGRRGLHRSDGASAIANYRVSFR